ncbi:mutS protein homolog 4-like [Maniola jurtina]|uniref:mutS protein homolog 4-like n=1 Tax=Maniola jurtina TaxID=191418 RepID=UPI001E68AE8B|nr:mutS protein homolog 4-like [Maniola jurtina]
MNVVKRERRCTKALAKPKNDLVRKDNALGIRSTMAIPSTSYKSVNSARKMSKDPEPRYQFNEQNLATPKKSTMGPPSGPPPSFQRRLFHNSTSSKPESSSSGPAHARVLVSDSAPVDSSDFKTPKNRPTALRYISSSSRGGHSDTRSARSTSTSVAQASVILAICEGRGMARGEIGMAAIDLRHPHLVLCQFSDTLLYTHTLTKINYFNPVEIIVPHTFCEGVQPSQLYKLIKDQYPFVNVTAVQRRHFNDAAGRQNIQTLCAPQYSAVYLQVLHKFYALTAAAAVLKYVEYIQCIVFARESLKIEYHSSENTMIIDVGTATQLELVHPLVPSAGPTCCLLGVLGPTYTVGGIRALRAAILQPSCNKEFIEARLDSVQELIESETGLMADLQDVIKKLSEIDKILFLCIETPNQNMDKYGEAQLNQTLLLKTTMEMVPKLLEAMKSVESGKLRKIKMDFENQHYEQIADRIRNVIQDEAHLEKGAMGSLQRCFAVKPEINGLLDVARRTYSELVDDIQKIVEQLSETYDLPIRLNQNVMKGFHIVLPVAPKNRRHFNVEDLPPIFIQVVFNGASVTMTIEELVVLDHQAKESLNEIQKMSNIVISTLLKELRPFMASLYKLCEDVAELDILLAMAKASTVGSYVRPEFDNYLEVRNSVHPLLDYNTQVTPVPNDILATPEHNFTIITGPNMGGKSIYIKQIAIMQIMAQLGCFLPATNAVLRLCDRLFSRIGFNDSVEFNASTYVIEMKETQHILKGLTSTSLVIIDELCRGTSVEEGTSMAWAICEQLILSEAFTFFTTHFLYLTRLQDLYYNVINRHTAVTEETVNSGSERRLVYQHKIEMGITKIEHYGLALAAKTNLPDDTVNLAKELAEVINRNRQPQVLKLPNKTEGQLLYELNARIRNEIRKNNNDSVKMILQQFKNDNHQLVEKMRAERSTVSYRSDTNPNNSISENMNKSEETNNLRKTQVTNNKKVFKPPLKISSTSTTGYTNSDLESNNRNLYATVKSSTDMLSTIIESNKDNNLEFDPTHTSLKENMTIQDNRSELNNRIIGSPKVTTPENLRNNDGNSMTKLNGTDSIGNALALDIEDIDINNMEDVIQTSDVEMNSESNTSIDSDIASAPTQLVEEQSQYFMETDHSPTLSDQELIKETVNEITEELNSNMTFDETIETLILTPPLEFR